MALNWVKNKKSNMYQFIDATWNTIKGACPHDCSYCYMKKWGKQPELHFDEKELKTDLGERNFIFVGSSCDMWAEDIPDSMIEITLNHCWQYRNKYLFQTKNPMRILEFLDFPVITEQSVICTTIETNRFYSTIMEYCPPPLKRAIAMLELAYHTDTYVTIEPIMDFDLDKMVDLMKICRPIQVNIGADTGKNNLPEPSPEKVRELIKELEKFTKVHQKKNLSRLLKTLDFGRI